MSEEKTKKQKETETAARKTEGSRVTVIYLGPAIPGVAVPGTVYNNGLPSQLEKAVKECPTLKKLLVDVRNAGQVRKEIKIPQSAASIWYQKASEYAEKKGAKG